MNPIPTHGYNIQTIRIMKPIIFAVAFLFSINIVFAQKPEPIYGFAVVRKSNDYYKQQATLWKKEIDKDKHNANAWYNYYRVNRNLLGTDTADHRDWKTKQKSQANLVEQMGKAIPNSFEYNLCKWMMSGNDYSDLKYLKAAAALGKDRVEIYHDMINWGEIERDISKRNEYALKLSQSEIASPGMMNYNYNVLMSLNQNAIILTCGDNDTYPLWELQAKGIRTDVMVLNLSLLSIDDYRDKIFKELGIIPTDSASVAAIKEIVTNKNQIYLFSSLIKLITTLSRQRNVYIGLTVDLAFAEDIDTNLYLVGMAYQYCTSNIDNIAKLKYNFEHLFALDYLTQHFYNDISEDLTKEINSNYVVPMLKLYVHYKYSGEEEKAKWLWSKLYAVAEESNQVDFLNEYLKKN